jgi:hypothetical protein
MATTHLVAIADHTDVPTLHTDELALGKGMDGAIVLCVVAVSFVFDPEFVVLIISSLNVHSGLFETTSSGSKMFSHLSQLASFRSSS